MRESAALDGVLPVTPRDIIAATAAEYGITVEQLRDHERVPHRVKAYQVAAYLCRVLLVENNKPISYVDLGRVFGRDHTSIVSAVGVVTRAAFEPVFERIKARLAEPKELPPTRWGRKRGSARSRSATAGPSRSRSRARPR